MFSSISVPKKENVPGNHLFLKLECMIVKNLTDFDFWKSINHKRVKRIAYYLYL